MLQYTNHPIASERNAHGGIGSMGEPLNSVGPGEFREGDHTDRGPCSGTVTSYRLFPGQSGKSFRHQAAKVADGFEQPFHAVR